MRTMRGTAVAVGSSGTSASVGVGKGRRGRTGDLSLNRRGTGRDLSLAALPVDAETAVTIGVAGGDAIQGVLVGSMIVGTTVTALVSSMRETKPVICPVCKGKGSAVCFTCCGDGLKRDEPTTSGTSGSFSYGFDDSVKRDGERPPAGLVGRNPRECRSCLGVGRKLCKSCAGTGYIRGL